MAVPWRLRTRGLKIAIRYSYNSFMKVSVAEAKNRLTQLIKAVEDGEPVIESEFVGTQQVEVA